MFLKERFFSRKPQEVQEGLEDPTVREFQRADVDTDHVDTVPIMDPTSQRIKPRTVGKSGAERAPSEAAMSKEELLQLASVGNVSACFQLGCRYLQGIVEEASPSQASRWFLRAVEEHHSDAQTNLGSCFLEGLGVYRNVPRALKLYRASAIQGNPHGQFNLGVCFRDGMGVKEGLREFPKSARNQYAYCESDADTLLEWMDSLEEGLFYNGDNYSVEELHEVNS
eukprot:gene5151-6264_t